MASSQAQSHQFAPSSTVDAEDVARFSKIASEWWDEKGKFAPLHRLNPTRLSYLRDRILEHKNTPSDAATPLSGISLLDIGCGGGLVAEPLARLGANVTGIDASEKNIAVAAQHAAASEITINYRAMPPEELVTEGAAFDVVLALEIIEHVADVHAFYATLQSLVKPGGLLIMSTINRTAESYLKAIIGAEYILRWLPAGTHSWAQFITPDELTTGLREHGFLVDAPCGITFSPLHGTFSLNPRNVKVNYFLSATKN